MVDRLKELIKYNAYQVAPAELEGVILTHPGVADVGVIGLPDPLVGELPHAWVVRRSGFKVTEENIVKFVRGNLTLCRGGIVYIVLWCIIDFLTLIGVCSFDSINETCECISCCLYFHSYR